MPESTKNTTPPLSNEQIAAYERLREIRRLVMAEQLVAMAKTWTTLELYPRVGRTKSPTSVSSVPQAIGASQETATEV